MKKVLIGLTLFTAAVLVGIYFLAEALQNRPTFYTQVLQDLPTAEVRRQKADQFEQIALELAQDIEKSDDWSQSFQQQEINSWLAEDLETEFHDVVPQETSDFRIRLLPDTIMLGFRLESRNWTGIASIKCKPWMMAPNQLALEVLSISAGSVPLPLDKPLNQLAEELHKRDLPFEWRQSQGNDVLVISLDTLLRKSEGRVIRSIQVLDGEFRVAGGKRDDSPLAAGSPPIQAELPDLADDDK